MSEMQPQILIFNAERVSGDCEVYPLGCGAYKS